MSELSQLAAEIAVAAAAAPFTQPLDGVSSASNLSALTARSSLSAVAAVSVNNGDDGSHDASSCSPYLSSTPPPFVAPDMHDLQPSTRLTVMPPHEQQQYREQLMRAPGLYACWLMRRIVARNSSNVRNEFNEHLLAGRVTTFEFVFAYTGLRREVSCLYTILGVDAAFRETPLQVPHVRFRDDGQEMHLVGEGVRAWREIHCQFQLKFMPYLLQATANSARQAL